MSEAKPTAIVIRRTKSGHLSPAQIPSEHGDIEGAVNEAKRLAALSPGDEFLVFASVASAIYEPVRVTRFRDPDSQIPF